ncbi:LINE-1 type transposase domain-containing protein 1 [Anabarilius grahami]|uniref:LINE-1 type transposase domain-containing protein 1 n=1 Tax=Anabarilius grahami TaxID=495550 RepID=A0A3N0XQ93_ANAGA|nr:LINE-1 type transposase domain-containing protein 1 [Anabarilius grahami]
MLERKIDAKFDAVQLIINGHRTTLEHLEQTATALSDAVTKLQAQVKSLSEQVSEIMEKCIDLEGRSKRQNIRIAGIREGLENGQGAREFVAKLFMEVLELDELPILDRTHRALRSQPEDSDPPRQFIARVHHGHTMENIMRKVSSQRKLTFNFRSIHIFRDYPSAVVKRRAAFARVRQILRDKPGVKFGILYPAKLRVTYSKGEKLFTDANEAWKFAIEQFGTDKKILSNNSEINDCCFIEVSVI